MRILKSFFELISIRGVESSVLEAHREHLLYRTRITMILAAILVPATGIPYFFFAQREVFWLATFLIFGGSAGSLLFWLGIKRGLFNRFYHLPIVLFSNFIISALASILFSLAGGNKGSFFFPYFLLYFGVCIMFPGKLLWIVLSLGFVPFSYLFTEWIRNVPLNSEVVLSNLIFLVIADVLAIAGNQILFALFLRDKRNQFKLEAEKEKLAKVTSQVAHDLRSPLTSLQAVLRHWKETTQTDSDYLNLLELSVKRIHSIANEVLDRHGPQKPAVKVFSIHRVLDELIGEYSSSHSGIRFQKSYDEAISCCGNRDRIQRAFGNIIKNAVEAMQGRGEITIRTSTEDHLGVVVISDQGPGIDPEKLIQVLRGGYSEGKKEGHGIGMTVVRETISEHGGKLEADSQIGVGTTFFVKLPLAESVIIHSPESVEEGAGALVLSVKPGEQLVVIDDDPSVQLQWELALREQKLEPFVYESYEDYLQKAAQRPLLKTAIVDYHYDNSELNGFEIIQKLKQEGFSQLYLCTGEYWKPQIQQQAKEAGAIICPKPIPKLVIRDKG